MSEHTAISWCDSTLNRMMGCGGCELWNGSVRTCYAGRMTGEYAGREGWPAAFEEPRLFPDRLDKALRWPDLTGRDRLSPEEYAEGRPGKPWLNGLPRIVFLEDMGDAFTEELDPAWMVPDLPKLAASPNHWLQLTKRAARAKHFYELHDAPPNLWLGVSVTTQRTADARIPHLLDTPRIGTRFVSVEPLLEPVVLEPYLEDLDWVIIGGESGPGYRLMPRARAKDLMRQCRDFGVPAFFKQDSGPRTEMIAGPMLAREMPR